MGLTNNSTGSSLIGRRQAPHSEDYPRIALAGNPNVGKSTLFNALTGMNQHTGNWSGKTVGFAEGICRIGDTPLTFIDVPGTYSLDASSPEERVAMEMLTDVKTDAIVVVCDAACLERNLVLALQILELGKPTVLCVNLMDEAKRKGFSVDLDLLSERLGIPVIGMIARKKKGIRELIGAINQAFGGKNQSKNSRNKPKSGEQHKKKCNFTQKSAQDYVKRAEELCDGVYTKKLVDVHSSDRLLDRLFTGRKTAYPIMAALLLLIFWLTVVGANYPSELLSFLFFKVGDAINELLINIKFPSFLRGLLIDGAYRTLAWVVSVMLPPIAIFFPLFTILEDSGYLPRIAYNLDAPFCKCRGCGKQALTMCMGFGCNAAGVVGCRIIDSPRERMVAILTNALVPCNGRFPMLISIVTVFFVGIGTGFSGSLASALMLASIIVLSIAATLLMSYLLSVTLLRGKQSAFILELPPYRPPEIGRIITRSLIDRTAFVLLRAVISAIPAGIILWLMANLRVGDATPLSLASSLLDPFARLLGLDGVILVAFILALPANEIVIPIMLMAYAEVGSLTSPSSLVELRELLVSNGWTEVTALCVIIFTLFHWPCATTLLTVRKETGSVKWMLLAAAIPTILGIILCAAINLISKML